MANPNAMGGVAKPRSLMDLAKPSPALRQSKIAARQAEKTEGRMARRAAAAQPAAPVTPEPAAPADPAAPAEAVSRGNQPWWWNPGRGGRMAGSAGPTSFGGAGTAGGAAAPGQTDTTMASFWDWLREQGMVR